MCSKKEPRAKTLFDKSELDKISLGKEFSDAGERKDTDFALFVRHISKGQFKLPVRSTITLKIGEVSLSLIARARVVLEVAGASFAPWLATDVWTSVSNRSYYGIYLGFVACDWQMIGLPLGVYRLLEGKTADELVKKVQHALHVFGIVYRGCSGGVNCPHADPNHTEPSTHHSGHVRQWWIGPSSSVQIRVQRPTVHPPRYKHRVQGHNGGEESQ